MISSTEFKSTLRQFYKNKLYLFVNLVSLSVGLVCCIFAFLYINNELSFDKFHEHAERIYRLEYETISKDGNKNSFANLHGNVIPEGLHSIPEIEVGTRFALHADLNIDVSGTLFGEENVLAADNDFFNVFSFEFLDGNPTSSLQSPESVVIDESSALKYFGTTEKLLGEIITVRFQGKEELLTITGIIKDIPGNSHFDFNLITSPKVFEKLYGFDINEVQMGYNYIRLKNNADPKQVQAKINVLETAVDPSFDLSYTLEKLTNIHLYSSDRAELSVNGNVRYLFLLGSITLLILIIGCINFTTLTTARSLQRTTELSVRKVYGAFRSDLIRTFMLEGALFSLLASGISLYLFWEFLPLLNSVAETNFTFSELTNPVTLLSITLLSVLIGGVSVIFPALVFTTKKTSSLLSRHNSLGFKDNHFWKGVIVFQLSATLILVSVSYIIHQQISFIQNKNLGFHKEQIITFPNYFGSNPQAFLDRVERNPNISETTVSSYIPGISKTSGTALVKAPGQQEGITFDWITVDANYLTTYDLKLVEGRNFSSNRSSDSTQAFIINETAAQMLGLDEPLGKRLEAFGTDGYIIGVVQDFNFLSLHNQISPLIMLVRDDLYFSISARFKSPEFIPETISYINEIWEDMLPGVLFSYSFVDQQFNELYKTERKTQSLFLTFSGLAILISVLGLFSFTNYSIRQKQKEIGIRKVVGAETKNLLLQFYSGYFKFLLISVSIAFPLVYLWTESWLRNFYFHTTFSFNMLFTPVLIIIVVILLSVSHQIIKGALANPVDTLKSE